MSLIGDSVSITQPSMKSEEPTNKKKYTHIATELRLEMEREKNKHMAKRFLSNKPEAKSKFEINRQKFE